MEVHLRNPLGMYWRVKEVERKSIKKPKERKKKQAKRKCIFHSTVADETLNQPLHYIY